MNSYNEDDLLKLLFKKIKMDKVPDGFTSGVMNKIMADPVIKPSVKLYFDWWWIVVGPLSILSMYLAGVFPFIYEVVAPDLLLIFQPFIQYLSMLYDHLPTNVVSLPSSVILPAIISGILLILMTDKFISDKINRSVSK